VIVYFQQVFFRKIQLLGLVFHGKSSGLILPQVSWATFWENFRKSAGHPVLTRPVLKSKVSSELDRWKLDGANIINCYLMELIL
jgi:hypothetical protein